MKLLLDENIPFSLYKEFPEHHPAFSVSFMRWNGLTNGELLKVMIDEKFDALITWDQNIVYQQNFKSYPITVFVFCTLSNDHTVLAPLVPKILQAIKVGVSTGPVLITG